MSLRPVPQIEGPQVYCGPTAISGVTGVPPREVVWAVQRLRADYERPVVGMDEYEVCNVLGYLGYMATHRTIVPRHPRTFVRLGAYLATYQLDPQPFIVGLTNHYVASDGAEVLCNWTRGLPVPAIEHPCVKAYARSVLYIRARR